MSTALECRQTSMTSLEPGSSITFGFALGHQESIKRGI